MIFPPGHKGAAKAGAIYPGKGIINPTPATGGGGGGGGKAAIAPAAGGKGAAPAAAGKGPGKAPPGGLTPRALTQASWLTGSGGKATASRPAYGAVPSIAEACEGAARGDTSGNCVTDADIKVFNERDQPVQFQKYHSFDQCAHQFPPQVVTSLKAAFPGPSQIQAYAWPLAAEGRDIIGIAATGSGKTLAFLLPAFAEFYASGMDCKREGVGLLVMSPTRELAQQIEVEANRFGKVLGMWVCSMYGGSPRWDQLNLYRKGVHAIIACPGRLNDFLGTGAVKVDRVRKLVLDEADRMLDMGFEPQIRQILQYVPPQRHNMFFSATWPRDVRQLASTMMVQPWRVMIGNRDEAKANTDVIQEVRVVEGFNKKKALVELLHEANLTSHGSIGKALVFASTKRMCEELSVGLHQSGVACAAIHGDKEQRERDQALNGLKTGRIRVLCATDVAARGLDIKGVGLVVNYDPANNTEDHVHRIGRTGRAGAKGYAVSFLTNAEGKCARDIMKTMQEAGQEPSAELRSLAAKGGSGGWGGRGGWGGGKGGGGGGAGCIWCKKGECWTHQGGKGGGRERSKPPNKW